MCFEIAADQAENVEALIHAYPDFVEIEHLPAGSLEEKLTTLNALYDRGLVVTEETLDTNWMYSDDDDDDDDDEEVPILPLLRSGATSPSGEPNSSQLHLRQHLLSSSSSSSSSHFVSSSFFGDRA